MDKEHFYLSPLNYKIHKSTYHFPIEIKLLYVCFQDLYEPIKVLSNTNQHRKHFCKLGFILVFISPLINPSKVSGFQTFLSIKMFRFTLFTNPLCSS